MANKLDIIKFANVDNLSSVSPVFFVDLQYSNI